MSLGRVGRWLGLALLLALAGCERPANDASAVQHLGIANSLHPSALMDAAFGNDQQLVEKEQVRWRTTMTLPELPPARLPSAMLPASTRQGLPEADAVPVPRLQQRMRVAVVPREVIRFGQQQAMLVIESVPLENEQRTLQTPTTRAYVGAIHFSLLHEAGKAGRLPSESGRWRITRWQPVVDAIGYDGTAGASQVYKLALDDYLLTFQPAACWQGVCGQWLHGYTLRPQGMEPSLHERLAASNRTHAHCADRLGLPHRAGKSAVRQQPAADAGATAADCFDVQGEVHPISREGQVADVSIRYRGQLWNPRTGRQAIQQTQLYRYQEGRFELVEGAPNPVPEF